MVVFGDVALAESKCPWRKLRRGWSLNIVDLCKDRFIGAAKIDVSKAQFSLKVILAIIAAVAAWASLTRIAPPLGVSIAFMAPLIVALRHRQCVLAVPILNHPVIRIPTFLFFCTLFYFGAAGPFLLVVTASQYSRDSIVPYFARGALLPFQYLGETFPMFRDPIHEYLQWWDR